MTKAAQGEKPFFTYLPVHDRHLSWGLYVTGAGCTRITPGQPYPPPGHPDPYAFTWERGRTLPEYTIILISSGEGTFKSRQTGAVPIIPGSLILLFPDIWHSYRPDPKTGWREHWISLNGSLLHDYTRQGLLTPERPVWRIAVMAPLQAAFDQLIYAIRSDPKINPLHYAANAMEILSLALELDREQTQSEGHGFALSGDPVADEAMDLIWSHSYRQMPVRELAAQMKLIRRTLERHFRSCHGQTVAQAITRCRLVRAETLLRNTSMPIKQVAYAAGFASPIRMNKVFRRILNAQPSNYRRS